MHAREPIKMTKEEIASAEEEKYVHKCDFDFCKCKFKKYSSILIHRASCVHNYATTDEVFTIEKEKIVGVFGHKDDRWFLVKWEGYADPEWEREHLLKRDKCHDTIRSYWSKSDPQPSTNM